MRRLFVNISLAILLLAVLPGCRRRPLEDPDYRTLVKVKVDISGISNVTCDIYNDKIPVPKIVPEAMHLMFFGEDASSTAAEAFITDVATGADGSRTISGELVVAPGTYRLLAYDFGTEATLVRNYNIWDEAEAYTESAPKGIQNRFRSRSGEPFNILEEPDHLVVAASEREVIPYHEGIYTIYAQARSVVESWYLQIKVDGLEYVSSAQAVLSGMVGSNLIATNTRVTEPEAAIWFNLQKSDDKGVPVICTVFGTFGRIDRSTNNLEVTFNIQTTDGKTVVRTFDISGLFETENAIRHHWLLLDETIKIDPPQTGGGFDPKVDDWDEEQHDVII